MDFHNSLSDVTRFTKQIEMRTSLKLRIDAIMTATVVTGVYCSMIAIVIFDTLGSYLVQLNTAGSVIYCILVILICFVPCWIAALFAVSRHKPKDINQIVEEALR